MAQSVEHMLGKHEVPGPNPGSSSSSAYGNRIFPVAVFCFLQAVQEPRQRQRTGPCKNWRGSVKGWTIAAGRSVRRRGTVGLFTKRPGEKRQKPRDGENRQGVRYKCPACRILSMSAAEIDSLRRFPVFPRVLSEAGAQQKSRPGLSPASGAGTGGGGIKQSGTGNKTGGWGRNRRYRQQRKKRRVVFEKRERCGADGRPFCKKAWRKTAKAARRGGLSQTAGKKQRIGYSPGKGRAPCPFRHRVQRKRRAGYKRALVCCKRTVPDASAGKKQAPGRLQKDGAGVKSRKNQ